MQYHIEELIVNMGLTNDLYFFIHITFQNKSQVFSNTPDTYLQYVNCYVYD